MVGPASSRGARYLVSSPDQPRMRRASDLTAWLLGALLILWAVVNVERPGPVNRALANLVEVLPAWTGEPLSVVYSFGFVAGVAILLLLLTGGRAHRTALRDVALALIIAATIGIVLVRWAQGAWPVVVPELGLEHPQRQTPVFRIAVTTATLVAASPHLVRPLRRAGWSIIALLVVAGSALGFGLPSDALGAIGVGIVAAATVFLVLGAPSGVPDLATISDAMARLGVPVTDLRIPASRSWGVRRVLARQPDGREVQIKVYGRDATDQQLLAKLWRSLWYREQRHSFTTSRLQAVQQEALLTLWAARAGVGVPEVLAAGAPDSEVALLALDGGSTRLRRLDPEQCTDDLLTRLWEQVATLHAAGIAHGQLDTHTAAVAGERIVLEDLGTGSISASEAATGADVAGLLFSLAALVGPERAVATARRGLGDDRITAALPYLQLPALAAGTRALAARPKAVLAELSDTLRDELGREPPEPVELRRAHPRTLLLVALGIVAAWTLIPAIAGIDLAAVVTELADARWLWLVVALIIGQGVFLTEATSMMFATTATVPFHPLVVLQVAAKFTGVVAPGVTGTVAANATFLSRFGVSPAASLTQGTMDAVAGMLVEVAVLLLAFGFSDLDLGVDLSDSDLAFGRLMVIILVLLVAAAAVVAAVPKVRDPVLRLLTTIVGAVRSVVADPVRALGLLGGNLATRVVRALVLWSVLVALDQRIGLGVVLVVVIATGLLQGLVPVPGGIGVAEAVMAGFLVALGVPEAPAFAATIVYRAVIFYLPILQGGVAMVWLGRRDYL